MVIIGDSNYHRMQPLIACVVNTNIFINGNGGNFIFSTHGDGERSKKMTLSYGDRSEKPTLSYGGMVNLTPLVMEITPKLPILAGGAPYHLHIASAPPGVMIVITNVLQCHNRSIDNY